MVANILEHGYRALINSILERNITNESTYIKEDMSQTNDTVQLRVGIFPP